MRRRVTPTDSSVVGTLWRAWSNLLLDPTARTYWAYLVAALLIAAVLSWAAARKGVPARSLRDRAHQWFGPSARTDYLLTAIKPLFFVFWALPWALTTHGLAVWFVRHADRAFGRPELGEVDTLQVGALYTLVLFIA